MNPPYVLLYRNRSLSVGWIGWAFSCSIEKKEFLVSLVDQLFQPALGSVENDVWYLGADLLFGISRDAPSSFRKLFLTVSLYSNRPDKIFLPMSRKIAVRNAQYSNKNTYFT